jgi:hypothetical protein
MVEDNSGVSVYLLGREHGYGCLKIFLEPLEQRTNFLHSRVKS